MSVDVLCEKCNTILPEDWENSAWCEPCNTAWHKEYNLIKAKEVVEELLRYVDKKTAIALIKGEGENK
jgi:hypothetical protein